jgi:hypothetical protein
MNIRGIAGVVLAGLVGVVGLAGSGCKAKLSADLKVDGAAFEPASCRSGQVYAFRGVELTAKDGRRLRLVMRPDGQSEALLFSASSPTGVNLGACGAFVVNDQNSTINDIKNVEGSATLSCSGEGHSIEGSATFENCH